MDISEFSSYSRTEAFEGLRKGAGPGEMTAQGGRQVFDTSWQPSASGDKTSSLEALYHDRRERQVQVEKEISNKRVWSDPVDTRLQFLESCHRQHAASDHYKMQETSNPDPSYQEGHGSCQEAFPRAVTQKELQEKEERKKLKEKIKELEARNKELLSKAMGMHKHSENMNDPLRLSAVLHMYEMLRLHDWEKLRSSRASYLSYKTGSSIIKGMMQKMIRNLFKYSYYQNDSEFYSKIVMQAGIDPKTTLERQFTLQCCKIYCLLLLQDPPVKASWNLQEHPMQYVEHVDKKDWEHWGKPAFLWPVMKCKEQVVAKGVIWDEK
ncbi:uncharacterized protein LOC142083684 isoform X2 [Calonectris borealis]|uniref:uncharacterized protein LOC142083684 isoform X2 n=1 Tax=Calonectris borealis TaxID=1323832 RepID=UPI003F4BD212